MLSIITAISALILLLATFSASAAQLPANLMDKDNPGQEYWCQGNDINTSMCSLTGVSDDHKFALIQDLPGPACEDLASGLSTWCARPVSIFLTMVTVRAMCRICAQHER
jgi:hypothetical protein